MPRRRLHFVRFAWTVESGWVDLASTLIQRIVIATAFRILGFRALRLAPVHRRVFQLLLPNLLPTPSDLI